MKDTMSPIEMLKEKVRKPDLFDEIDLPTVSYSKLDTFNTCQMKYDFIYNQKKRDDSTTLALELGSLAHKVLELKGLMIKKKIILLIMITYLIV